MGMGMGIGMGSGCPHDGRRRFWRRVPGGDVLCHGLVSCALSLIFSIDMHRAISHVHNDGTLAICFGMVEVCTCDDLFLTEQRSLGNSEGAMQSLLWL